MTCDVLVVGGGPAGSTCASQLVRHGLDVVVLDRATFPRDKVCAGWITPAVVSLLRLDVAEYARSGRTFQAFTGFRTARFDTRPRLTRYERPISFGIRRCEFDAYLLDRSGARVMSGQPLRTLAREAGEWIANGTIRARFVVGAGGHFCPVARALNPDLRHETVVVAQEIECRAPASSAAVAGEWPELYFWPDLLGYGWCVRKGDFLNVGAGRLGAGNFPAAVDAFKSMLRARGLGGGLPATWKGHAYLLNRTAQRRVAGDGAVLVGDAAGLALAPSGEGILAAVESGVLAAETIREAAALGGSGRLMQYADRLAARFGPRATAPRAGTWPDWLGHLASAAILQSRWMTRRLVIEDGFLHLRRSPLAVATAP